MYIDTVPNRTSPPAILVRESFRRDGKTRKRTIANLSKLPPDVVEGIRVLLKGGTAVANPSEAFDIVRSLPHGHVAAALGTLRRLDLDRIIDPKPSRERDRVLALVVARILSPSSMLAIVRGLTPEMARNTLGETLGVGNDTEDDLYAALDWLLERQGAIEGRLAERHLDDGTLSLCELTSMWVDGQPRPLAPHGHSPDGKLRIEFGLMCDREGRPVAFDVFEGNIADPGTVSTQVHRFRDRFGLDRIALVDDRGMLTEDIIREDLKSAGFDWITTLREPAVLDLMESGELEMSLFDNTDLVELRSDICPGERLMVRRNPLLAEERAHRREMILQATEARLELIAAAVRRNHRPLRGRKRIRGRARKVIDRYGMSKHFDLDISDDGFGWSRKEETIARDSAVDDLHVVRTSLPERELDADRTVLAYRRLKQAERAFRSPNTIRPEIRPPFRHVPGRVRAHILLCMLAHYVEWHMRERLQPLFFDDEPAAAPQGSAVAPTRASRSTVRKERCGRTADGLQVHKLRTLLRDLATVTRNRVVPRLPGAEPFDITTRPTSLQQRAFDLLEVRP